MKISDQISFGMEITNIILSKSQNLVKTLKTHIKPLKSKASKWHENQYGDGNETEDDENDSPQTPNSC